MLKVNTVIIDDNENCASLLKLMLSEFCPEINIVGCSKSYGDGIKMIEEQDPDLIFLDIDLLSSANVDGFSIIDNFLNPTFKVIVVTGSPDYAVKAFDYKISGFLLKPINGVKLVKNVSLVTSEIKKEKEINRQCKNFISIPSINKVDVINVNDILYFYAEGRYTFIKLKGNKEILSSRNLKEFESKLHENMFFRIHKSYIININNVDFIDKRGSSACVLDNGDSIPISRRKREVFNRYLGL